MLRTHLPKLLPPGPLRNNAADTLLISPVSSGGARNPTKGGQTNIDNLLHKRQGSNCQLLTCCLPRLCFRSLRARALIRVLVCYRLFSWVLCACRACSLTASLLWTTICCSVHYWATMNGIESSKIGAEQGGHCPGWPTLGSASASICFSESMHRITCIRGHFQVGSSHFSSMR